MLTRALCVAVRLCGADEMLNMGFQEPVEAILQRVPRDKPDKPVQTLLFSATVPEWGKAMRPNAPAPAPQQCRSEVMFQPATPSATQRGVACRQHSDSLIALTRPTRAPTSPLRCAVL